MKQIRLQVLTPQGSVFDGLVDAVVAPLPDGWIGVLPGHTSFEARLLPGGLVLRVSGQRRTIATIGGTLSVDAAEVTVLTGAAALDTDLDTLEQQIGDQAERARAMEQEAEKHFSRVYRALADTLGRGGRRAT